MKIWPGDTVTLVPHDNTKVFSIHLTQPDGGCETLIFSPDCLPLLITTKAPIQKPGKHWWTR